MAAPMPRVPPVTRARRPMSSFEITSLLDIGCSYADALIRLLLDSRHLSYNRLMLHMVRPSQTEVNRQIGENVAFPTRMRD
jgi:hypothetical protein